MSRWLLPALACVLLPGRVAVAADAPPGASSCSGCHAAAGSTEALVPSLAGRPAAETASVMGAFKSGARPATVMGRIAQGFSDAEIDAMAQWFAAQGK